MYLNIIYPEQTTYFICYNSDRSEVTSYGSVEPTTQMGTGQPILDQYLDEDEWLAVLLENGITPDLPPPF